MNGSLFVNWAAIALSILNAMLLFWLALTVLLNSDRRAWGLWLAGIGLGLGGIFFLSHAAILERGLLAVSLGMIFWWTAGLIPALSLPFAWYIVVLWYAGISTGRSLRRRQLGGLALTTTMLLAGFAALFIGAILIADLLLFNPLLTFFRLTVRWSLLGIPLLAVGYSVYVILCIGLAIDALVRPGPTDRVMGVQARQRARPWLIAVSGGLLLISLLGVIALMLIVQGTRGQTFTAFYQANDNWILGLDLVITAVITVIILLLGQAVVAYEVFTGKSLPRWGLVRRWRQAILLAVGYGLIIGGSVAIDLRLIYSLLLTAVLMTVFFALFSWRTFHERDQFMTNLRPFVSSQRLYDQLLGPAPAAAMLNVQAPFGSLCADVLNARYAYLGALGPMAPLVGLPLVYPADRATLSGRLAQIGHQLLPQIDAVQLSMGCFLDQLSPDLAVPPLSRDTWVVPLVGARGIIGLLLLGPKCSDEFYTQEEIEVARASSERLLDAQASTVMAQRLMALQRQRLQQSQIVDRRSRQVLHDDILPYLHTAMLALGETPPAPDTAIDLLTTAHREISNLLRDLPAGALPEIQRLGLLGALETVVSGEFREVFDDVSWQIAPDMVAHLNQLPTFMAEVVFYAAREAIRNAARHGRGRDDREGLRLQLAVAADAATWKLIITDNGVGLSQPITEPKQRGSGHGLALHSTMMAVIGGTLALESEPNAYTRVVLTLGQATAPAPTAPAPTSPAPTSRPGAVAGGYDDDDTRLRQ